MIKYPKNSILMLMPGRVYKVVSGILIKRVVIADGAAYCNLNVFLGGSYFKSDGKEYLAVTPLILKEETVRDVPSEDLSKQVDRLEGLVEILCAPRGDSVIPRDTRLALFSRWWAKWVGSHPSCGISQEQIASFTGMHRTTVNRKLSQLTSVSGVFDDND